LHPVYLERVRFHSAARNAPAAGAPAATAPSALSVSSSSRSSSPDTPSAATATKPAPPVDGTVEVDIGRSPSDSSPPSPPSRSPQRQAQHSAP
jgi:hypothetical protein